MNVKTLAVKRLKRIKLWLGRTGYMCGLVRLADGSVVRRSWVEDEVCKRLTGDEPISWDELRKYKTVELVEDYLRHERDAEGKAAGTIIQHQVP